MEFDRHNRIDVQSRLPVSRSSCCQLRCPTSRAPSKGSSGFEKEPSSM